MNELSPVTEAPVVDSAARSCVLIADPVRAESLLRAIPGDLDPVIRTNADADLRGVVSRARPQLVIAHVKCPHQLQSLRDLKADFPDIRIVAVADDPPDDLVIELLVCEVDGLVVNPAGARPIEAAIRDVLNGTLSLDQFVVRRAVKRLARRLAQVRDVALPLTPREIEIARLVARGLSNKEIAVRLFIEEGTIKVHLHNIFDKLQIGSRAELSEYARAKGLVQGDL